MSILKDITNNLFEGTDYEALVKEASLTDEETEKKEDIVHGLKKKYKEFRDRYGKDAKSVMYATATKLAKEDIDSEETGGVLTELSKSMLSRYIKRAAGNSNAHARDFGKSGRKSGVNAKKVVKRHKGISLAADKLARPDKPEPHGKFLKSINDKLKDNQLVKKQAD